MMAKAITRAMKVMLPLLRINTESHRVAELDRPCMPMVMTGYRLANTSNTAPVTLRARRC
ncbi:hypothetical protein D3C76_1489440 [compost metagenome]